ncbi:MAG: lipid-binding SYLF domain-containing protein [Parvularculaceae bacterium]
MAKARKTSLLRAALVALAFGAPVAVAPQAANAGAPREEAMDLVADATKTAAYFAEDGAFEPLWNLADDAKALVIVPEQFRAGFIIGGSAGAAVLIARNRDGSWSQPTFLTIGSISFGFQAGGEASEIVLAVMTQRGLEQILSTNVKLGGDVSIAAGPLGAGAKAQTTDILAFSRSRGLYGGGSLEGAILKTRHSFNRAYYGTPITAAEVIFKNEVYNPASAPLQEAVIGLANRNAPPLAAASPGCEPGAFESAPLAPADGTLDRSLSGGPTQLEPLTRPTTQNGEPVYEDDAAWDSPRGERRDD